MRLAPLLLAAGCSVGLQKGASVDTGGAGDTGRDADTDVAACTATVTGITPVDGELAVARDAAVVATFSGPVTAADIAVDGARGTVTLAGDGTSATFTPTDGFAAGTAYTVTASACGDEATATFTTVGEPLAVDLVGRTYDVELTGSDLEWVAPNVGDVLANEIQTDRILFMVEAADTGRIDIVGAAGFLLRGEPAQYRCTYAFDFAATSFAGHPAFAAGPLDAGMEANDIPFTIYGLAVTGQFAADGSAAEEVVITGLLDTRPLAEGLAIDVCGLATSFGDTCEACPDGETGCLALEIHDASAPWRVGLAVNPDQDPTTDRYCAD